MIGWLSPLHVASALYPATRWIGLTIALLLLATIAGFRRRPAAIVAGTLAALAIPAHVLALTPAAPAGWTGLDMHMGKLDQADYAAMYDRSTRVQLAAQNAFDAGARVVVVPEEIIGMWRPSTKFWWQGFVSNLRAHGQTLVLGVDLVVSDEPIRYSDSAVVAGAGLGRLTVASRSRQACGDRARPLAPCSVILRKVFVELRKVFCRSTDGTRPSRSVSRTT